MSWKQSRDLPPTFHTGKHHASSISTASFPPSSYLLALCTVPCAGQPMLTHRRPSKINIMLWSKPHQIQERQKSHPCGETQVRPEPGLTPKTQAGVLSPISEPPQTPKTPKSPSPLALRRLAQPVRLMGLIPGLFPLTSDSRPLQHPITQCGPCQTTNPRAASGSRARSSQSQGDANVSGGTPFSVPSFLGRLHLQS